MTFEDMITQDVGVYGFCIFKEMMTEEERSGAANMSDDRVASLKLAVKDHISKRRRQDDIRTISTKRAIDCVLQELFGDDEWLRNPNGPTGTGTRGDTLRSRIYMGIRAAEIECEV